MNEWSEVMETTRFSRRGCSVTGPDPATRSDDECEHDCHEHNVPGPADRIAGLNQEGEHEPEPGVRPKCRSNQRELVPWPPQPLPAEAEQQYGKERQPGDPEHEAGPALRPHLVDAQGDERTQPQEQWPRYPTVSERRGNWRNSEHKGDQDGRDRSRTGQLAVRRD
jgi:hypothetical protein